MSKVYILQKDMFLAKAGTRFTSDEGGEHYYASNKRVILNYKIVENNPEWFIWERDIDEKIKVLGFYHSTPIPTIQYEHLTVIATDGSIKEIISERYSSIVQAFEDIINDRYREKRYTEGHMLVAFSAGKLAMYPGRERIGTFEEFMSKLK